MEYVAKAVTKVVKGSERWLDIGVRRQLIVLSPLECSYRYFSKVP